MWALLVTSVSQQVNRSDFNFNGRLSEPVIVQHMLCNDFWSHRHQITLSQQLRNRAKLVGCYSDTSIQPLFLQRLVNYSGGVT